jgi:spoIIIJ-associated protein
MLVKADINVIEDKENEALIVEIVAPEETGLIIGSRGRTLNSLQIILGMIFKKRNGTWRRVIVDVSGWRNKEKERLENLAELTAQRAEETGEPQYLYNLSPSQRRLIHMFLAKKKSVNTESQGEDKERCLVVTSKN